jgi:hypothetical protein
VAGDGIHVEFSGLQDSIRILHDLREHLLSQYIQKFDDIGTLTGAEADNSPFGGALIPSRDELWTKHNKHWQAAYTTYRNLAEQLRLAMEGTQRVLDNYKTTEDRNHANATDVERLLDSGDSPSGGASPPPSGSPPSPGQKAL